MQLRTLIIAVGAMSVASAVRCLPAEGQWFVSVEVGSDRFWGGSEETTPEHRSFRPYRPTTFGVGIARRAARFGVGLGLRYASASLALEGSDALVAAKGIFDVYTAAPEVVYRVTSLGRNALVLHGGPLFEVWGIPDDDSQTRVGMQAAASLRVPLGGRFAGALSAGVALIASPFTTDQLESGFERRTLWRRRLAGGLEYRL